LEQVLRYSNQREDTYDAGLREGEEKLFHANQLVILAWGEDARAGTVTSREEHFSQWRDIACEEHRIYDPPLGSERPQEVLVQGMLPKSTLLNIVRNFIMAPRTVLDYVVAHEVAHLIHTEAFWGTLDCIMPDYRERKGWLRQHGVEMTL